MDQGAKCDTPHQAVEEFERIYKRETSRIIDGYKAAIEGHWPSSQVRGQYPQISVRIHERPLRLNRKIAYGYCAHKGVYTNTFTRPDIFSGYVESQLRHVKENHPSAEIVVSTSNVPIPLGYALDENFTAAQVIPEKDRNKVEQYFDLPVAQHLINQEVIGDTYPLSWYNGPRTDRSLNFLRHYTGTNAGYFQPYIIFTNYADYIDTFTQNTLKNIQQKPGEADALWSTLISPGNCIKVNNNLPEVVAKFNGLSGVVPTRMPQMPAYHAMREDGLGVTVVNIGVGPSNAKTITDHIAPLRPQTFLMVGHCAGLSEAQEIGDYVIPNGYIFEDGLVEKKIENADNGLSIPELSEIHRALKDSAAKILKAENGGLKESVRTGIVTTTADRNWECPDTTDEYKALISRLGTNRSMALDMESGVIAAQGFMHHVPYGALLCVSDKPLHGQPKLPGVAQDFYRARVRQQLDIAMGAMTEIQRTSGTLHSRKLRSDWEYVPFR